MKHFRQQSRRPKKSSLIVGEENITTSLREGKELDRIFIDTKFREKLSSLAVIARQYNIPVNYVPSAKIKTFNIEGSVPCIAQLSRIHYLNLQDVISQVVEKGETPLMLLLDGITDVRNIGGIARTAWCCGVHAIIIPDKGVGALQDDAVLASAGALEHIAVCRVNSLMKAVDELHLNGIKVFATEMTAPATTIESDFTTPCAFVMGSEQNGIYPALLKICDEAIRIPMVTQFESLNVSVATGMLLYEAMRQRMVMPI